MREAFLPLLIDFGQYFTVKLILNERFKLKRGKMGEQQMGKKTVCKLFAC